jgi:hypothetical protein
MPISTTDNKAGFLWRDNFFIMLENSQLGIEEMPQ